MKKLLALLLVVLMTLGLMLGCAKTQTEMAAMSDESTEAPAAVEPSSTTTEAEPVTAGGVHGRLRRWRGVSRYGLPARRLRMRTGW